MIISMQPPGLLMVSLSPSSHHHEHQALSQGGGVKSLAAGVGGREAHVEGVGEVVHQIVACPDKVKTQLWGKSGHLRRVSAGARRV